mgnify:CR=1 FL=1
MAGLDIFTTLDRLENRQDYLDDAATLKWITEGRTQQRYEDTKARQGRAEQRAVQDLDIRQEREEGLDISYQYKEWLSTIQDEGLSVDEIKGTGGDSVKGETAEDIEKRTGFQGAFGEFHQGMLEKYEGNTDALNFVRMYGQGVTEAYDLALREEEGSASLISLMEQLRKKDYGSTAANPISVQDVVANIQRAKDLAIHNDQLELSKALASLEARAINQAVVKAELRKYTHAPYSGMDGEPETVNLLKHPGRAAAYTGEIPLKDTDMVRSMEFFSENTEQYHKLKEVQLRAEQGDWIGAREKLDTFHQNVSADEKYKKRLASTLTAARLKTDKEIIEETEKVQRIEQRSFATQLAGRIDDFAKEDYADNSSEAKEYMVRLKSLNEAVNYTEANWTPETSTEAITIQTHALFDEIWRQEENEKFGVEVFEENTDLVARDDYVTQAILLGGVGSVVDGKDGRGIKLNTNFGTPSDREFRWYKKFDENNKLETTSWNLPSEDSDFKFGDFEGYGSGNQANIGEAMKNASLLYLSVQPEYIEGQIRQATPPEIKSEYVQKLKADMTPMSSKNNLTKQIKRALSDDEFDVNERIDAVKMAQGAGLTDIDNVLKLLAEENLLTKAQEKKFKDDWATWSEMDDTQKKSWHKQWGGL